MASLRLSLMTASTACSWMSIRPLRGCPRLSNAPALTRDSTTRLLQTASGTLRRKSWKLVYRPWLGAGRDDALDDVLADVADRAEPEADVVADGGEPQPGLVHVGRQDLDAHAPGLGEVDGHLVLVGADRGEQGGHVLGGVVGLEVGGPVGHEPVPGGVGLVEPVGGERQQHVPDRLGGLRRVAVVLHAGGEQFPLLVHLGFLLLAHRPAQDVGAAEGVPGELAGDGHDLLLVDDQVVGLAEDLLQRLLEFGVDRLDFLLAGLAQRVVDVGLGFHRAGAAEGEDGGDVLEPGWPHQLGQVPHHAGVELEDAEGLPGAEDLVGFARCPAGA